MGRDDGDSTPTTGGKRQPSGEYSVMEMVRDISKKVERGERQNTEILVALARIEGNLSVGNTKFDGHNSRIDALEKRGDKSNWAVLGAAGAIIMHLINYITHGGKP